MDKDPFKEYIKQSEPNKRDKGYAWHTAIGLQEVRNYFVLTQKARKINRISSG